MKSFAVTGTHHGDIIQAQTEGEARRLFHKRYKGESIIHCLDRNKKDYFRTIIKNQQDLEK